MTFFNKKNVLALFLLSTLLGCSGEQESKKELVVEDNSSKSSPKLMKELEPIVGKEVVYSFNNKNYEIDSLPKSYRDTSGLDRKRFLDLYLKYKLTLDSLSKEQELYKKEIDKKIKSALDKIKYRGINQSPLDKTVYVQKLTLEKIALEEVAKKEENLTQKIEKVYTLNEDKFKYPNTIELSLIVFKDKEKAEKVLSDLNKTKATIELFGQFAAKNSIDRMSRINDGYSGYMTKETAGEEIFNTVWNASELGLVNQVLEKKKRFILVYIHKKMKAGTKTLESVHEEIREKLLSNKKNRWIKDRFQDIVHKTKVKIYDSFENNETFK